MSNKSDLTWKGYAQVLFYENRLRFYADALSSRIHDTKHWDKFDVIDFKPKTAGDYDIDIKIDFCGVCGTDVRDSLQILPLNICFLTWVKVHTITGGWGQPILVSLRAKNIRQNLDRAF